MAVAVAACKTGNLRLLQSINSRCGSIDFDTTGDNGWTALHYACDRGNEVMARWLLSQNGVDVNATTDLRQTALHLACYSRYSHVASILVKFGAEMNVKDGGGSAPLHIAVTNNDENLVTTLLRLGANPNFPDLLQRTPLHIAFLGGQKKLIRILLMFGGLPTLKDRLGRTCEMLLFDPQMQDVISRGRNARSLYKLCVYSVRRNGISIEHLPLHLQYSMK